MADSRLGMLEYHLTFKPFDGSETVETISTPSMWALADEWVDELRAQGKHTDSWYDTKLGGAIFLLAAQEAGLVPAGPITVSAIAEVINAYDIDMVEPESDENPTGSGREGSQAPA